MPNAKMNDEAKNVPAADEAPRGGTALVAADFGDDAGAGMENVDRGEYKIPFLRILDPKSPQLRPVNQGGIPGAVAGMILNTATNEVYKELLVVPVHRDHNYVEYIKRNPDGSGGGFVGIRAKDDPVVIQLLAAQGKFKKLVTADEPPHEIAETYYLYVLAFPCATDEKTHITNPTGPAFFAMIGFASTQIKKYQNFVGKTLGFQYAGPNGTTKTPPIWAHMWHATTQYEQRGQQSWYGWVLRLRAKNADGSEAPFPHSLIKKTDPLYQDAKNFRNSIVSGEAKADVGAEAAAAAPEEEIPFN